MTLKTVNNIINTYTDVYATIRFDYNSNQFEPCDSFIESQVNAIQARELASVIEVLEDHILNNYCGMCEIKHYNVLHHITDYIFKDIVTISFNYTLKKVSIYSAYIPSSKVTMLFNNLTKSNRFVELLEIIDNNRTK